jgi:hypothetical protein
MQLRGHFEGRSSARAARCRVEAQETGVMMAQNDIDSTHCCASPSRGVETSAQEREMSPDRLPAPAPRAQPGGLLGWAIMLVFRFLARLPWWLRAPIGTALLLSIIMLARAFGQVESIDDLGGAGVALGVAASAGLIAGAIPTLLWRPLRRLGLVGSLLLGVVSVYAYLICCMWGFGRELDSVRGWWSFLGVGTFFGLLVGYVIVHPLNVAVSRTAPTRLG